MTCPRLNCLPIIVLIGLGLLCAQGADAAIYIYERTDGSKLITDEKLRKPGYTLKKSYKYRSGKKPSTYFSSTVKSQYDAIIVRTALKYDLEPAFIKAIVHAESAFDRHALSSAGAMGLMQIMPATATNYQLEKNQFDANKNLQAGVQHLKDLMQRYNNDKTLSLAAYNAGARAVSKYQGVPPYEETQTYVKRVMNLYNLYKKEI